MANIETLLADTRYYAEVAAPSTPSAGNVVTYAKSDGLVYSKDDAGTETLMSSGIALSNPMTTAGDIIKGGASGIAERLAVGAAGAFLWVASGVPAWAAGPVGAAYTRTAGDYTTGSTSFVDVDATNMALTITTLARRVRIGFVGSVRNSGTSNISMTVDLDGTNLGAAIGVAGYGGLIKVRTASAAHDLDVSFVFLTDVLTAASHTFKLQWATAGSTATMNGGGTNASYAQFWVEETFLTA